MNIKEFLEKAISGGLFTEDEEQFWLKYKQFPQSVISILVLDPKVWEAVGKSCDWVKIPKNTKSNQRYRFQESFTYIGRMHKMIDHLCDGGTIETYLATL